jgi:hypothetical protein
MKVSKSRIVTFIIIGIIFSIEIFILEPVIKENYYYRDISNFEEKSWKYSIILALILNVAFTVYAYKTNALNRSFFLNNLIGVLIFAFFTKVISDNILLYLNMKTNKNRYTKSYVIRRDDSKKLLLIYDNRNQIIFSEEQLKKIESFRIKRKLKSLYLLQNNDTLNIHYKIGILNVKYLD